MAAALLLVDTAYVLLAFVSGRIGRSIRFENQVVRMPKDDLIRDIPLIRRYARHNEAQDLRFRSYLKMSPMSNAKMDAIVRETTDSVWAKIDCLACGNCCKTLKIVVDSADIRAAAKHLSMNPREFEELYVETSPEDGAKLFKSTPCMFLGRDNKCAIYEDRPKACRDFPYLHDRDFRSRTLMMIENTGTCPIVFNVWQRLKAHFWPTKQR